MKRKSPEPGSSQTTSDRNRARREVIQDAHQFGQLFGLSSKNTFLAQHQRLQKKYKRRPAQFQQALQQLVPTIMDYIMKAPPPAVHMQPLPELLLYDRSCFMTLLAARR